METTAFDEQYSKSVLICYKPLLPPLPLPYHLNWSDQSLAGWLFSLIYCSVNHKHLGVTSVGPGALLMHHQETVSSKYFVSIIAPLSCSLAPLRIAGFVVSMEWNIWATKLNIQPAMQCWTNKPLPTISVPAWRYVIYLNKRKIIKTHILNFRIDLTLSHSIYIAYYNYILHITILHIWNWEINCLSGKQWSAGSDIDSGDNGNGMMITMRRIITQWEQS